MSLKFRLFAVSCVLGLAACGASVPVEPEYIFPDEAEPTVFTRAYQLTESPDGNIRVFAKEDSDFTHLWEMHKQEDGGWSEPKKLDLPHHETLTGPSFDPRDGSLFYASDAPVPWGSHGNDMNIWRVAQIGGVWGEPIVLPRIINTGAKELDPAVDMDGNLYFTSNHTRGVGDHDIYRAYFDEEAGEWKVEDMPLYINSNRADSHLAVTKDGSKLFFYSWRAPKLGYVDIFMSEKSEESVWSEPVNIGDPVSTTKIEYGAGLSGDNETLFFSREGRLMQVPLAVALENTGLPEAE